MSITALETGLYNKLKADATLTTALGGTIIYNKIAPQGVSDPYVVFNWQGGGDLNESPTRMRNLVYQVQAIATTQGTAAALDGYIDSVLHSQSLTVSGWSNIWLAREGDINYTEQDTSGVTLYHVGGFYRLIIDS
jgi:hypothetical protein